MVWGCYASTRLALGNMEKNQYHKILDQIPQYRYCDDTVGLTIGAFTKYFHKEIFDKSCGFNYEVDKSIQ